MKRKKIRKLFKNRENSLNESNEMKEVNVNKDYWEKNKKGKHKNKYNKEKDYDYFDYGLDIMEQSNYKLNYEEEKNQKKK